jgi:hypothetical protein
MIQSYLIPSIAVDGKGDKPIPHSQHGPISYEVLARIRPLKVPSKRRLNFTKANWPAFSKDLDSELK